MPGMTDAWIYDTKELPEDAQKHAPRKLFMFFILFSYKTGGKGS